MSERCKIMLVGVGGGGCNTLRTLARQWEEAPPMAAMHTDAAVLQQSEAPQRVQLGEMATGGLSTGGNPETGRAAAEESLDTIRPLFAEVDLAIFVTGLGGGTGSGALPVILEAARDMGAMTLCLCTLPFFFEGQTRRQKAEEGLLQIKRAADAVVTFPNQRMLEWVQENTSLAEAFEMVDRVLGAGVRAIWKLLSQTGLINLDFSDFRQVVKAGGGSCAMACVEASGEHRGQTLVDDLMRNALLEQGSVLARASGLLLGVIGGPDMTLNELQGIIAGLTDLVRPGVPLHIGTAIDEESRGRISVTVLATEPGEPEPEAAPGAAPEGGKPAEAEAAEPEAAPAPATAARRRGVSKAQQGRLSLEPQGKGRFVNVEPTYYEGEDLDVPTFIRRRIKLTSPL